MIGHDLGTQSGTNLYHSFDKFNLNAEESATFTGPLDINNVFGRVTGGESFIDGQISSDMPNADIYLINPRGIMFGQNATLNVPGSFYASSADQIILKDGTTFSATNPQNDPPILSAEPFSAFGFLDDDTAPISITGGQFQAGKTFALVGGEITINDANISGGLGIEIESRNVAPITVTNSEMKVEGEGRIFFRGGELVVMNSRIQVDSESGNSRIEVDATEMQLTDSIIRLYPIGESDAGSILIGMGHLNSLNMERSEIRASLDGLGKAGEIQIKAANAITLTDNSNFDVSSEGGGDAGSIVIETSNLSLSTSSAIFVDTIKGNSGDAGSLAIDTGSLSLTNSKILGGTSGTGNAGSVQIKAANSITLEDESLLNVSTFGEEIGSGDAGSIFIETGSLSLTKKSNIQAATAGTGNAGSVQIKAANGITLEDNSLLIVDSAGEEIGSGNAGSLVIETGSLSLTNSIVGATTTGTGNAGNVQIKAANSITLEDDSFLDVSTLGEEIGSGDGGSLAIETGSLSLTKSSVIGATTTGTGNAGSVQIKAANSITLEEESGLVVATESSGDGGSLAIETGSLSLTKSSVIGATTTGTGNAGSVQIKAANSITLEEKSGLLVGTTSSGDGGSLAIETGSLSLTNSIVVSTTYGAGNAGDIQIQANDITLEDYSSLDVSTTESGDAGSLFIDTGSLSLTNSSAILATTDTTGNAGEIQIKAANNITLEDDSFLFLKTSGSGDGGSLDIETGSLSLTNSDIFVSTFGPGKGGEIQIKAANSITLEDDSSLDVSTTESGDAGSLFIDTGSLSLTNSSAIRATTDTTGNAGEIQIKAANNITLEDDSLLFVKTSGSGDGGSLDIETGSLSLTNSDIVAATWGTGNAGNIQIKAANSITLEEDSFLNVATLGEEIGSGDGGSLDIETGSLSLTNSGIMAATLGTGNAGEVQIKAANSITLEDGSGLSVATFGSGDAGSIDIDTGRLSLTNSSAILATTDTTGNAGEVQIKAANSITLVSESGLIVGTFGSGDAGSLAIETGSLSLTNSSVIGAATSGAGNAGEVQIKAANSITLVSESGLIVNTLGSGDAGSLAIETGSLSLTNSGIVASTYGSGSAGKITITASEYIKIVGADTGIFSASGSENFPNATGNAGTITIGKDPSVPAPTLTLTEGGEISTASWGAGVSGEIDINVKNLEINQGGKIDSSSQGTGSAGKIAITASEYINIVGEGSGIFSTSGDENFPDATGNAGTITIGKKPSGETMPVPTLTVTENGQINASTFGAGEGGEIDINVNNLEITQGGVINSSTKGAGAGGAITMTASENINIDGGRLLANTLGTGQGGEIHIDTNNLELTQGGRIDSSSDSSGHAGTITITASEYINLVGENSGIFGTASSSGNAGQIDIFAGDKLSVTTNSQISTSTESLGQGGEIKINTNQLELTQGGNIDSSSSGTGSAGKIAITASEYLKIFGEGSGIFSTASSSGDAGQINILAGGTPEDGVEIIPGSLFSAEAELLPHVRGGLVLENGGEISTSTSGQGNGGTITITSSKLRLNNAEITADNEVADFNQAGNIIIGAHQLDMSDSTISTSSTNADGGNILIGVRELNNKRITDSQIAATAGETGIGGNLEIRGPKYLILDSTNLKADADKGGNLTLDADVFIASTDSQIEASGVLQTPEHIDVGTISLLPSQGVDVSKMVKECTASDSKEEWSLKQVGYGKSKKKNGCHK
jgi:filamentous hemagglutinin family protein